ncbi:hypothetical protein HDU97_005471 [Phlyctochytrium planicorne]|nr:hypothetical protein HDU97_005471 [Phlyctochytrium planicorne]
MASVQLPSLTNSKTTAANGGGVGRSGTNLTARPESRSISPAPNPANVPRITDGAGRPAPSRSPIPSGGTASGSASPKIGDPPAYSLGGSSGKGGKVGASGSEEARGRTLTSGVPGGSMKRLDAVDAKAGGSRNLLISRSPSPAVPVTAPLIPLSASPTMPPARSKNTSTTPSPLSMGTNRVLDPIGTRKDSQNDSYSNSHAGHGNGARDASSQNEERSLVPGFHSSLRPQTPMIAHAARKRQGSMARSASNILTITCNDNDFPADDDDDAPDVRMAKSSFDLSFRQREASFDLAPTSSDEKRISRKNTAEKRGGGGGGGKSSAQSINDSRRPHPESNDSKIKGAKSTSRLSAVSNAQLSSSKKSRPVGGSSNVLGFEASSSNRGSITKPSERGKSMSVFLTDTDIKMSIHVQKLWRRVARKLLEMIRGAHMFSSFLNRNAAVVASHLKGTDDYTGKQVRYVFTKAKGSRTDEEMLQMDRTLTSICPALHEMGYERRSRLYDTMTYEYHPKGTVLSRVGVSADSVYFVVSGCVEVGKSILKPQFKYKATKCGVGSVLGAVSDVEMMNKEAQKRQLDMVLTADSDFVRVRVDDYIRAVYSHDGGSIDQKVVLLNGLPIFAHVQEDLLMSAVACSEIIHAAPDQRIVEEDEDYSNIYFLCKGRCVASKMVRFIKTSKRAGKGRAKRQAVIPWAMGVPVAADDELLDQKLDIIDILPSETFPILPIPPHLPSPQQGSRNKYLSNNQNGDSLIPWLYPTKSYVTITCSPDGPSTILSMPIHKFFELANHSMVFQTFTHGVRYRISVPLLQEAFLESIGYKELRSDTPYREFKTVLKSLTEKYKIMNFSPDAVPMEATGLFHDNDGEEETDQPKVEEKKVEKKSDSSKPNASHMGVAAFKLGTFS